MDISGICFYFHQMVYFDNLHTEANRASPPLTRIKVDLQILPELHHLEMRFLLNQNMTYMRTQAN